MTRKRTDDEQITTCNHRLKARADEDVMSEAEPAMAWEYKLNDEEVAAQDLATTPMNKDCRIIGNHIPVEWDGRTQHIDTSMDCCCCCAKFLGLAAVFFGYFLLPVLVGNVTGCGLMFVTVAVFLLWQEFATVCR